MGQLFTNNASSTLTGAISDTATSIPIQVADVGEFPVVGGSDFYLVTLESEDGSKIEVVKCDGKTPYDCRELRSVPAEIRRHNDWRFGC